MSQTVKDAPPVTHTIAETVADAEGVDTVELTPPLHDAVDTDALQDLFATTSGTDQSDIHVTFTYHGRKISVNNNYVSVEDLDE